MKFCVGSSKCVDNTRPVRVFDAMAFSPVIDNSPISKHPILEHLTESGLYRTLRNYIWDGNLIILCEYEAVLGYNEGDIPKISYFAHCITSITQRLWEDISIFDKIPNTGLSLLISNLSTDASRLQRVLVMSGLIECKQITMLALFWFLTGFILARMQALVWRPWKFFFPILYGKLLLRAEWDYRIW
jgi:hypothetical protein